MCKCLHSSRCSHRYRCGHGRPRYQCAECTRFVCDVAGCKKFQKRFAGHRALQLHNYVAHNRRAKCRVGVEPFVLKSISPQITTSWMHPFVCLW